MKFASLFSIGLLSFSACLIAPSTTRMASAQCVMTDVGQQVTMSGSRRPTDRTNNVNMQSQGPCTGNSITTTGEQLQQGGTAPAVQRREVNQQMQGGSDGGTGVTTPTVRVIVNPKADVFNPADDPNNPANRIQGR